MGLSLLLYSFAFKFNQQETISNLNRISVVLVEQGKTEKWLAEQLGKSTCTISKWCTNSAQPDLYTLDSIAQLLKIDRKDLLMLSSHVKLEI